MVHREVLAVTAQRLCASSRRAYQNPYDAIWFGTFCRRYAGRVYPDRTVSFAREYASGEDDVVFFARVAIFEELVDRYNSVMGRDARLAPVARSINGNHHAEETRHLVFGRHVVEHLWGRHRPGWSDDTVDGVRRHLAGYLTSTWRSYYNPDAYRDAGGAGLRRCRLLHHPGHVLPPGDALPPPGAPVELPPFWSPGPVATWDAGSGVASWMTATTMSCWPCAPKPDGLPWPTTSACWPGRPASWWPTWAAPSPSARSTTSYAGGSPASCTPPQ